MARNPEYQFFLDIIDGRKEDDSPKDLETQATSQEIGWWKQHQFKRAMRKASRLRPLIVEKAAVMLKCSVSAPPSRGPKPKPLKKAALA